MKASLFDYKDYKKYLSEILEAKSRIEKGQRSKLSKAINCQPAYLSQVLNGNAELSPEQALAANQFLGHTEVEGRFFLNLVLWARAGTKDLKNHYLLEIKKQLDERLTIKNRVTANRTLSDADQSRYYSSWHYAAIHALVSLPNYRNRDQIARALKLSAKLTNDALEFLVAIGILKTHGPGFLQGETSLYLGADSSFIHKHHANWRLRALQSLDQLKHDDLHYSGVITCSVDDLQKLREIMIQTVQKARSLVKESKDETLAAYMIDVISLKADESSD